MKKFCCENIELIVEITRFELDALGMYYNRPASELIYLIRGQHNTIHKKDKPGVGNIGHKVSEETKRKMSKVDKSYMQTDAYKTAHRAGNKVSDETRKKMSESRQGLYLYNNGVVEVLAKACPSGYKKGRIK